jgi:uncharacterized damage-inducible protein DinB
MNKQDLFVKMALHAWEVNLKRVNATFNSLSDEQLFEEIAPGKNRVIYLLGHLTAVHDRMLPLLGFGNREYLQLDDAFISNPDKAIKDLPPPKELRTWWTNTNELLARHFSSLSSEDWFQKHTMMSDEDFVKEPHRNRLSVLLTRTNHLAHHLGQLVLLKD